MRYIPFGAMIVFAVSSGFAQGLQNSFYEIVLGVKHFFRTHIAFSFSLGGAALPSSGVLGADHPQQ